AMELMQRQFSVPVEVSYALNGTGANILALKAILGHGDTVLCAEQTHINTYECGALEAAVGAKILSIESPDGKMTPALLDRLLLKHKKYKYHPKVLAVTQPTEFGTVYSIAALKELCAYAHSLGLLVFLDGARLGAAASALNASLQELIEETGVDIFTFGGTKAGAMFGEMIVSLHPENIRSIAYFQKQCLQHLEKSRFLGAQMEYILETGLWLANAARANEMARLLARRLEEKGVEIYYPVETNMVFCVMAPEQLARVTGTFDLHYWDEFTKVVRLATTCLTSEDEINSLSELV
ncbi:MAG: aminotransferase class I/II-fold pyridoxal phosphate-dependent enzyme, partial [Victivallales bacterium]|nr:aminotransferase class I/II-fold pyridoxal phosphate-dependent enzyme [Victivallales bacterium]